MTLKSPYSNYLNKVWKQEKKREQEYRILSEITKEHKKKIALISAKLKVLNRQVKRVREREQKVRHIIKAAEEFTGIKLDYKNQTREASIGRDLIYKFALERKIEGNIICHIIKCDRTVPSVQRNRFNRYYMIQPEYRDKWYNFKQFINNYMIDNGITI